MTAGYHHQFQALGGPDRTLAVPSTTPPSVSQDVEAPSGEQLGSASAPPPTAAPGAAPHPSTASVPCPPPPGFEVPPSQPSTSCWVPSGPPPSRSVPDSRTSSESEASDAESDISVHDSVSSCLADLIYEVCLEFHPVADAVRLPRCGFAAWFGQPESAAFRQRFWLYPRVAEVESEVSARAEALARRAKPLSYVLPRRSRRYVVADDRCLLPHFQLTLRSCSSREHEPWGLMRWGSISFAEMERIERVFRNQLEVTSSSLWLMSGILAMLKRDGFQPSDPTLFNAALSSVSAAMSQQARSVAAGSTLLLSKRRESLLSHTSVPVPEAQRRSLTTAPGSRTGLFDESLLGDVLAQVQRSSMISFNLAVSCSFSRARSRTSSSSPLVDPSSLVLLVQAGRPGNALPPPRDPEEVSALGAVRGQLLLPNLRVFGSRSHRLA